MSSMAASETQVASSLFACFIPSNYSHLKIKREGREGAETRGTVMSHSGGVSGLKVSSPGPRRVLGRRGDYF